MTELVVMVEEPSAGIVVETLLQRMRPERGVIVVPHRGRSDLRVSVPRKIAAWQHPPDVPFLILHDNDRSVSAVLTMIFCYLRIAARPPHLPPPVGAFAPGGHPLPQGERTTAANASKIVQAVAFSPWGEGGRPARMRKSGAR